METSSFRISTDCACLLVGENDSILSLRQMAVERPQAFGEMIADMSAGSSPGKLVVLPLKSDGRYQVTVQFQETNDAKAPAAIASARLIAPTGNLVICAPDAIECGDESAVHNIKCTPGQYQVNLFVTDKVITLQFLSQYPAEMPAGAMAGRRDLVQVDDSGARNMMLAFGILGTIGNLVAFVILRAVIWLFGLKISIGEWYVWLIVGCCLGLLVSGVRIVRGKNRRSS
jgi:hypothetical protein